MNHMGCTVALNSATGRTVVIAAMFLFTVASSAQNKDAEAAPRGAPVAAAQDKSTATENTNAATAQSTQQSSETSTAPKQTQGSPFDYRPSEEISEDLSVSFPVDI